MQNLRVDEIINEVKKIMLENHSKTYYKPILLYHEVNNEKVGVLYGWLLNKILFIDEVVVNEEHRRKGIATSLIKQVIEIAKERKCEKVVIYLLPFEGVYLLESLVKKLCFEFNGTSEDFKIFTLNMWYR